MYMCIGLELSQRLQGILTDKLNASYMYVATQRWEWEKFGLPKDKIFLLTNSTAQKSFLTITVTILILMYLIV